MWRLLLLAISQSLFMAFGQLTLKMALDRMPRFEWSVRFWGDCFTNWWFLVCGLCFGTGSLLWAYLLKHYPLSQATPLVSMSYVFTILLAIFFLHEQVEWNRWIGMALVVVGCILVAGR